MSIYDSSTSTTPFASGMYTGQNNQWGAVFTQLVGGFSGGFWGSTGISPNPYVSNINLGWNSNWAPTFGFGENLTSMTTLPSGSAHWDSYAKIFYQNSNSYGTAYSDNLMKNYATGQPQLPISNTTYNTATNVSSFSNVDYIYLNVFDDYETPSGYTTPTYYDYVTPLTGFDPVNSGNNAIFNLTLTFINGQMELRDGTPISIDFLTTDTGISVPVWQNIIVPQTNWTGTGGPVPRLQTIFTYNASTNSFSATGAGAFDNIQLNNLPLPDLGGIGWYRLHIGSGSAERTTNFYLTTSIAGGINNPILNPYYSGQAGTFGIDGLIGASFGQNTNLQPIQYVSGFTLNYLPGSAALVDSTLLDRVTNVSNTVAAQTQPSYPLIGTLSGATFNQFTDYNNAPSSLAFGWAGAAGAVQSAYTNKVSALDVAQVKFVASGGTAPAPISATGDLDGQWTTAAVNFGAGSYTATMTEYLWSDQSKQVALTSAVSPSFTVPVSSQAFDVVSGGDGLQFSSSGNWLKFQVLSSSILSEATVLLYATTAAGDLVSRDGHRTGGSVTLDDAVCAKIGSIADDHGHLLVVGNQSVYLPAGLELHFAIVTGDNIVTSAPAVSIGQHAGNQAVVTVAGAIGTLQLTAASNNELPAMSVMAESQRTADKPWAYLTHGSDVGVEVIGSCFNVNTLGFVHVDVNPSTGTLSVGGVAYGANDAFYNAVRANLDTGFSITRGGDFNASAHWTVAGNTGLYAPVLLTPTGETLVIGNGNVDGRQHVRIYAENTFGFEDTVVGSSHSDFDYNDMIVKISVNGWIV